MTAYRTQLHQEQTKKAQYSLYNEDNKVNLTMGLSDIADQSDIIGQEHRSGRQDSVLTSQYLEHKICHLLTIDKVV